MRSALFVLSLALGLAASAAAAWDGELDATFGSAGQVVFGVGTGPAHARAAAAGATGIYVVGDLETSPGNFDFLVERLDFAGHLTGASGPIPFDAVPGGADLSEAVAVAPDGKVVVAGTVDLGGGLDAIGVVRLDGATLALDAGFGSGGKVGLWVPGHTFYGAEVAVLGDGAILVGCTYGDASVANRDFGVFKLDPDGTRDSGFGSSGLATVAFDFGADHIDSFRGLAVQPDGRIVVAGSAQWGATDFDFAIARLQQNGQPDTGFGPYGTGKNFVGFDLDSNATDLAADVAIAADGRIAVGGYVSRTPVPSGGIAMLNAHGNLDPGFDFDGRREVAWIGGSGTNEVGGVAFESDGSLFVAGDAWTQFGAQGDLGVTRLAPDGSYDCTFYACFYLYDLDAGWEYTHSTALDGGRPLLVGTRGGDWAIVRLTNGLIFRDGFENQSTSAWSLTTG